MFNLRSAKNAAVSLASIAITLFFFSACRMGANNEDKLSSLKSGEVLDENGEPILEQGAADQWITISSPTSRDVINLSNDSSAFTVSGTCTLEGATIDLSVDGADAPGRVSTTCAGASWSTTFASYQLSEGSHSISATITQPRKKSGSSKEVAITRDVTAPTASITSPSSGTNIINSNTSSTYSVQGACFGSTSTVTLTVDGAIASNQVGGICSSSVWSATINTTGLSFGSHILAVSLTDSAGNTSSASSITLFRKKEATQIAVGYDHSCALLNNGEVQCWGTGSALGNNSTGSAYNPVKVVGLGEGSGATQISAGQTSCARLSDGTAKCWGTNALGQIGDNSTSTRPTPVQVMDSTGLAALTGISSMVGGSSSTCAIMSDTSVRCWGYNTYGNLGDNSTTLRKLPVPVKDTTGIANLTGVTSLVHSTAHTCAVLSSGQARCWGYNAYGQTGDNTVVTPRKLPVTVLDSAGVNPLTGVQSMHVNRNGTTCASLGDNTVHCWGVGDVNQQAFGDGTIANRSLPSPVKDSTGSANLTGVSGLNSSSMSAGGTCAILASNNEPKCWGFNYMGNLGRNSFSTSTYPASVISESGNGTLTGVSQLGIGRYHACALQSDNQVRCWGGNQYYQLGQQLVPYLTTPTAMKDSTGSAALTGVTSFGAGGYSACIVVNGAAQCWGGDNSAGLIGNNTNDSAVFPQQVLGLTSGVSKVAVTNGAACALLSDATVWCWGSNNQGQQGVNSTTSSAVPVQVKGVSNSGYLTGVSDIVAGYEHMCAIISGTPYCWGKNSDSSLGDNTSTQRKVPVKTKSVDSTGDLTGVTALASGSDHTCALVDGGVYCWGDNGNGQIGNNAAGTNSKIPTLVSGLSTGVTAIDVYNHSCALKADNTVWCWGYNIYGSLGDNTTTTSGVPVQVQGLPSGTIMKLTVNYTNTCVLVGQGGSPTSGAVYCWGYSGTYDLGADYINTSPVKTPVLVAGLESGVTTLFGSTRAHCVIQNSQLKCWGPGSHLRNQSPGYSLVPIPVNAWAY